MLCCNLSPKNSSFELDCLDYWAYLPKNTTIIFFMFRVLFPDLHDEDFVLLTNDTPDGIVDHAVNSMSLLHPLILPRLYPPLFTLYALQTEKTDAVYIEKLYYLNKRADIALMSFLGIKR